MTIKIELKLIAISKLLFSIVTLKSSAWINAGVGTIVGLYCRALRIELSLAFLR